MTCRHCGDPALDVRHICEPRAGRNVTRAELLAHIRAPSGSGG